MLESEFGGMMAQNRSVFSILFFIGASSLFFSCSKTTDGGFITDAVAVTDCPQKSCAQGIPDATETKILLQTPINNVMPVGSTFAEVAGDCYASLFPQNYFEVTITYNGLGISNYFPAGFIPKCDQGKFYFPVNLTGGAAGSYMLTAQLVVVDSQGIITKPAFKTVSTTLIKR
jgi:hypothetical protein